MAGNNWRERIELYDNIYLDCTIVSETLVIYTYVDSHRIIVK